MVRALCPIGHASRTLSPRFDAAGAVARTMPRDSVQEGTPMVFGTGIDDLVMVSVALSLPLWLAVEELINRTRPDAAQRPAEESRRQAVGGMVEHPVH